VEENHGNQSPQQTFHNHEPDTSSLGLTVWRPDSPVFDDQGLLVEDNRENRSSQQTSQQGDPEEDPNEDDGKLPASNSLGSNPFAPLAEDSDGEDPNADTSRPDNTSSTEDQGPRTYASVAGSSSGSGDGDDQPDIATLTKLPDTGMRQRRANATIQPNKRDRTPKAKRAPKDQATTTPSAIASIARNVCTDMLSPIMGDAYVHCSSEDACPTNLNDSKADESKTVGTPKSPEADIHIQSSSSSSHQPPSSRTRLTRSTSREREARLASDNQRVTRSRSAERTNTPASAPQAAQHNLTPNARGRPRSGRGKGKSKSNKRLDFR